MGQEEIESLNHKGSLLPRSFNIKAAFGLSYEVVGVKPVCITIVVVFLLATAVFAIPMTSLMFQNSETETNVQRLTAQVNALTQQVQTLHLDIKNLQHLLDVAEQQQEEISISIDDIDDDESQDTMFYNETRVKRAPNEGKEKSKKKKDISVKQFRGGESEGYISPNALSKLSMPKIGYIGKWKEEIWVQNSNRIRLDRQTESIEVTKSGVYLLTAQITFAYYEGAQDLDFTLQIQPANKPEKLNVSKCYVPTADKSGALPHTCSTSLFVCLNKSDKIYVYVRVPEVEINMGEISSLIGLAYMSKIDSCPAPMTFA